MKKIITLILSITLLLSFTTAIAANNKVFIGENDFSRNSVFNIEDKSITYVDWIEPPDTLKAATIDNRVTLNWDKKYNNIYMYGFVCLRIIYSRASSIR